ATSGLENPLTFWLLGLFFWRHTKGTSGNRSLFLLSLLAGLCALNRLDTILIVLPTVAWAVGRDPSMKRLASAALGAVPLLLWELFSLVYYGFLFPNTAYAKLGSGFDKMDLWQRGFAYFANSALVDPATLAVIAAAIFVSFRRPSRETTPIAAGIALYLLYIFYIGGDFMSGRFFAAPFYCALILLLRTPSTQAQTSVGAAAVVGLGIVAPFTPLLSTNDYGRSMDRSTDIGGIADERQYYYPATGLLSPERTGPYPAHGFAETGSALRERGPAVTEQGSVGFLGFMAGPGVHIIDVYAITDPLLARLPAKHNRYWRIGHFVRDIPDGYGESLETGTNQLADPKLARLYDALGIIVSGPLFSPERWQAIADVNLGRLDP
ncbi:MAG: hypothetical protein QGG73_12305, partial [Candidatus Hydrogenedentes bacterium]|nr:hypothetical protein [Candidatus Hydrogenedentota bacterium]